MQQNTRKAKADRKSLEDMYPATGRMEKPVFSKADSKMRKNEDCKMTALVELGSKSFYKDFVKISYDFSRQFLKIL